MLDCGRVVSVVVARKQMLTERRAELEAFLRGFKLSWLYYARNAGWANRQFADASRLEVTSEVLVTCASVEPNRQAGSIDEIRLELSEADRRVLDEAHGFLRQRGIIRRAVDIPTRIDLGGVHDAEEAEVELDTLREELGIELGGRYPFHLFFAERHTINSSFRLEMTLADPIVCD